VFMMPLYVFWLSERIKHLEVQILDCRGKVSFVLEHGSNKFL
jgi:hypothetical protein